MCGLLVHRFEQWAREKGIDADPFVVEAGAGLPPSRYAGRQAGAVGPAAHRGVPAGLGSADGDRTSRRGARRCARHFAVPAAVSGRRPILPIPEGRPCPRCWRPSTRRRPATRRRWPTYRSLWGLAKFWITTAAEQGVDVHDEQALQDFVGRARGGEVPYDPEVLQTIVERHTRSSGPVRSEPQLPVALPGDDVLREQAGRSPVLRQLRELAEWARRRRTLTGSGRLRLSDARDLVERLNTGDDTDSVRLVRRPAAPRPPCGVGEDSQADTSRQGEAVRGGRG